MGKNQMFFPRPRLDEWIAGDCVGIDQGELTVHASGLRFALTEALSVVKEVSDGRDVSGLVGRVLPTADLRARGGELLETSLVLGEAAYEVQHGFLLSPIDPTGEPRPARALFEALSFASRQATTPDSDAELLARYLMEKLD
jgi:hypothetical protein